MVREETRPLRLRFQALTGDVAKSPEGVSVPVGCSTNSVCTSLFKSHRQNKTVELLVWDGSVFGPSTALVTSNQLPAGTGHNMVPWRSDTR